MDAIQPIEIVNNLCERLRACYIFPDAAEQICAGLQKHLEEGEYTGLDDGELLALALTLHLQEVNRDEHLWVRWHAEALPEHDGQLREDEQWQAARRREAEQDRYGLGRAERLPGNVGYLELRYFHRPEWAGEALAAAMEQVARTDALILDLRRCTGGYPGMVALLCSYLFGAEALLVDSIYWRDEDRLQEYWTQPRPARQRFDGKPVYALISRATFSAGEEMAYILKIRQRAVLLGEKTDGGAHPGASYRIHPHFEVFIPVGRVINPLTGADWEGSGVPPDVSLPAETAFTAAYRMALEEPGK